MTPTDWGTGRLQRQLGCVTTERRMHALGKQVTHPTCGCPLCSGVSPLPAPLQGKHCEPPAARLRPGTHQAEWLRRWPMRAQHPSPGVGALSLASQARVRKFGPKRLQLLAEWTETFPRDFQAESTIGLVKDVVGRLARCDEVGAPSLPGACSPLCSLSPEHQPAPPGRPCGVGRESRLHPAPLLPCSHHCHPRQARGDPQLCGCWSGRWSASGRPAWQGRLGLGPQASPSCPCAAPGLAGSQPPWTRPCRTS